MNLLEVYRVDLTVAQTQQQVLVGEAVGGHGVVQSAHRAGQGVGLLHGDGRDRGVSGPHPGGGRRSCSCQVRTVTACARGCKRRELRVVDYAFIESSG